mmetsp:Transcript_5958/g.22614  ORF Transcript_5958/g.22614 Transcript_5958/m.22614 type:complete len:206 (-) Transcript_5958:2321-2938(-)
MLLPCLRCTTAKIYPISSSSNSLHPRSIHRSCLLLHIQDTNPCRLQNLSNNSISNRVAIHPLLLLDQDNNNNIKDHLLLSTTCHQHHRTIEESQCRNPRFSPISRSISSRSSSRDSNRPIQTNLIPTSILERKLTRIRFHIRQQVRLTRSLCFTLHREICHNSKISRTIFSSNTFISREILLQWVLLQRLSLLDCVYHLPHSVSG